MARVSVRSGDALEELTPPNAPGQQSMEFPIAKELGLLPTSTTYEKGIVSKVWATSAGEGATLVTTGDETAEVKLSDADGQERYKRVAGLDHSCLVGLNQIITGIAGPDQWKQMLLIDGEEEVVTLPFVGISGMPATPAETLVGEGLLLLTRVGGGSHRLHFAIKCDSASMEADEAWGERDEGCLCCTSKTHDVSASYKSKHGQDTFFSVISLDNNIFHCHSQMEDQATLAAAFGGKSEKKDCCQECCKCVPCCGPCCGPCCPQNTETSGTWSNKAKFSAALRSYTDFVVDEGSNNTSHKFPGIAAVTHHQQHAMMTSQLHALHLVYRDTATNSVKPCIVVVSPRIPIPTIGKFASWLSTLVTADPEPPRSVGWLLGSLTKGGGSGGAVSSGGSRGSISTGDLAGRWCVLGVAWFPAPHPMSGCFTIKATGPDEFKLDGVFFPLIPPCVPVGETYRREGSSNKFICLDQKGDQKCCGEAEVERDGDKITLKLSDCGGISWGTKSK